MKNLYFLFLLLIIPEITLGSHAMGADISYNCLGNNLYQINFTFYRDCSGIPAPSTLSLDYGTGSINLNPLPNMPVYLHTACPTATTTCNGGTVIGIEKWVYSGVVTLPVGTITVSHQESARNAALTTIAGAGSDNLYVYATIVNNPGECNESPVFYAEPTVILCLGNFYCIPPFVNDPDGDSLAFELITPRTGSFASDTVSFLTGYSTQSPLTSSVPITMNHSNGELCLLPNVLGEVTPIAMLVSEYRNGILIGQVERDMQVRVEQCNNNLPDLVGFNGLPVTTLNVCANQQNCFFITGSDLDAANTTFVTWDGGLSNAVTTHSFGHRDTLYICWTPSDSDTLQSNCFNATATDDNCPFPGLTSKSYCLNVIPSYICNPNGINEVANNSFALFPQPAVNELNFQFEAIQQKRFLNIYPVSGKAIGRYEINDKRLTINTSSMSGGIYIAAVTDEFGSVLSSQRLIIIR